MAESITQDEDTIKLYLVSDDAAQAEEALLWIDRELKEAACGAVRKKFIGLSAPDLLVCWKETLGDAWDAAKRKGIDLNRPLLPFVYKILVHKVIDRLRRKTTFSKFAHQFQHEPRAASASPVDDLLIKEAMTLVDEMLDSLPAKQRLVLRTYYKGRPHTEDMKFLRDEVAKQTNDMETVVSVKRAKEEGMEKVKQYLEQRGVLGRKSNDERGEARS